MKVTKLFLIVVLFTVAASASAQFINASSSRNSSGSNTDGWGTVYAEYNPSSVELVLGSGSFTAFSLGFSEAFSLTTSIPLFWEVGAAAQYSFKSDFILNGLDFSMLSAKVPLSLIYKFDIPNSSVSLMPYAGLDARFNIFAKEKYRGITANMFDKDDVGSGDNTWNRFQVGWHIGLKALLGQKLMIGASYGKDITELAKNAHIETITVTVGTTF